MPTRQTNPASDTDSDAAVPGLDLTIALVKEVTNDALAAARPHASMAALDDALSETAAGPIAVSTRQCIERTFHEIPKLWSADSRSGLRE